jgi:hypothetical protein
MNVQNRNSFFFILAPLTASLAMGACTSLLGGIDVQDTTSSGTEGAGSGGTTSSTGAGNHAGSSDGGGGAASCSKGEKICDGKCAPADTAHGCEAVSCDPCPHQHGDVHCVAGACEAFQCDTGFKDCDGKAENGCEVNIASDDDNCGDCGHACPQGMQFCGGSQCSAISCTPPQADCDGLASNQCEVDTSNDAANCGACKHVCGAAQGTPACTGGGCQFACNGGFAHCSNDPADDADGCNVDTTSDSSNCGSCGHACATAAGSGSASCSSGNCQFNCTAPYVDCGSGHDDNGCNVNTSNDASNCGGCGIHCNGPNTTGSCESGVCTCKSGYVDYDGNPANGCEGGLPSSVPEHGSLVLWLEGDVGYDSYTWLDQSGASRHAGHLSTTAPGTSTLNGKTVLTFLNGEQLRVGAGFPAWSGFTIFGVSNTHVGGEMLAMGVSYNPGCSATPPNGSPGCVAYDMLSADLGLEMCDPSYGSCYHSAGGAGIPLDQWIHYVSRNDPSANSSFSAWLNGADTGATSTKLPPPWNTPRTDTLLPWAAWRGQIAEMIVFNEAISDASRAAIDAYLTHKWGF